MPLKKLGAAAIFAAVVVMSPSHADIAPPPPTVAAPAKEASAMTLTSPDFTPGGAIPAVYTCEGKDVSPALSWSGVPEGTRSLALVIADPDAPDPVKPQLTWSHWVLYNLPPDAKGLPQGVAATALPPGTLQGKNDWKRTGYGGPCPPIGRHRYFHRLYALDVVLPDLQEPSRESLEAQMKGHILATAELMGTYQKSGRK